mgnify:FL=1
MLDRINKALRRLPTWSIYLFGLLPLVWIVWLTVTNGYGPDPVKGIEHGLGLWAIRLMLLALLVTPLRWLGLNLLRFRRQIGLVAFAYVVLHLFAWISIDMAFRWNQILPDLYKRPYILIGMAALLLLVPLAVTSNDRAIRWLGALRWNRLHKLAYLVTILGMIHFLMIGKVYTTEVLTYSAILTVLLGVRIWRNGPARLVWA